MRTSLSLVRSLSPLLLSIVPSFLSPYALQAQSTKTEIDYTGSLYGYYRMEFNEPDQNHLPPVTSFLAFRKKDPTTLLLGMGDNFGPEFGAAIQLENLNTPDPSKGGCNLPQTVDPDTKETRPESLYKNDDRVAPRANCDNVLNFLMHAGFRAVVPGSQDFMYTAKWLRVVGAAPFAGSPRSSTGGGDRESRSCHLHSRRQPAHFPERSTLSLALQPESCRPRRLPLRRRCYRAQARAARLARPP